MKPLPGSSEDLLDWQDDAACRRPAAANLDVMFPDARDEQAIRLAKGYCGLCSVLEKCRKWGLAVPEPHGVWGGLTEQERQEQLAEPKPRKPRRAGGRLRSPCGTQSARARHRRYGEACETCWSTAGAISPDDPDGAGG